jgi:RNA recognition motif-containing protein
MLGKRLYVGGLSYDTSDDALRDHFAQVGSVESAMVARDRYSGRSRGFGFVEMDGDADAQKAIAELNGKDLDGRRLTVDEAKPRPEGTGGGGGGGGGRRYD